MTPEASGNNKVKQLVHAVVDWFESRLGLGPALGPIFSHPVPKGVAGPMGWFYVFGSASMTMLGIQFVTGILLALVYVPSADKAYESLLYLNYHQQLGWFLRALHYYAGSAMVAMVLAHMTQVFLHGAYKYPRELTWIVGVFLFACTMGMFFTGQILRWDPDAYWGLAVGASMAGRVPVAGPWIVQVMLGSAIIGGGALSRFFALHVFVIPGALLGLLAVHLWLVLQCGVSAPPVPGQLVNPDTYKDDYHEELKTGVPFAGDALLKDIAFSAVSVILVVVLAAIVGPKGPTCAPNPIMGDASPRPEWPFLWLFALLSLSPASIETFIMLVFPAVVGALLLIVPAVSNRGERSPTRRPLAVMLVIVIFTTLTTLTYQGATASWSPQMGAWKADPVPEKIIGHCSPRQLMGAVLFQVKNCRNCHALEGKGGERGPDLTDVGGRLTQGLLIDQVSNGTPGGGDMPAYGRQLNAAEMTALVDFLQVLRPEGRPVAREASSR